MVHTLQIPHLYLHINNSVKIVFVLFSYLALFFRYNSYTVKHTLYSATCHNQGIAHLEKMSFLECYVNFLSRKPYQYININGIILHIAFRI